MVLTLLHTLRIIPLLHQATPLFFQSTRALNLASCLLLLYRFDRCLTESEIIFEQLRAHVLIHDKGANASLAMQYLGTVLISFVSHVIVSQRVQSDI